MRVFTALEPQPPVTYVWATSSLSLLIGVNSRLSQRAWHRLPSQTGISTGQ